MEEKSNAEHADAMPESSGTILGGGEMDERIRSFSWSGTRLESIADWHKSLSFAVNMMLQSPTSMVVL